MAPPWPPTPPRCSGDSVFPRAAPRGLAQGLSGSSFLQLLNVHRNDTLGRWQNLPRLPGARAGPVGRKSRGPRAAPSIMTCTEQDCSPGRTGEIRAVVKELVQTRVVMPQTHLTCQRSLCGRRVCCGGRRWNGRVNGDFIGSHQVGVCLGGGLTRRLTLGIGCRSDCGLFLKTNHFFLLLLVVLFFYLNSINYSVFK